MRSALLPRDAIDATQRNILKRIAPLPAIDHMSLTARLRGAAFALLLVTTALVGSTLLLPPAILLPLGFKKLYTKYASFIAWW